jgi:ribosomal-protein-alanine N-acetyltransferase
VERGEAVISVQAAENGDIAEIAAIEAAVAETPWSAAQFSEELGLPHARLLAARDGGEIVGFLDIHIASGDAHINELGVTPSRQNEGIGWALMSYALALAKNEGCTVVSLEVRESNHAAIRLYEKAGFAAVGKRKRFYTCPDEDGLIMLKEV